MDEGDDEVKCPFCGSTETCDHLLLVVDTTFREAQGGPLYRTFNARWAGACDPDQDPDFDEREAFDELLESVHAASDAYRSSSPDSAPGMSASYAYFFCRSKKRTLAAVKGFIG